MAVASLYTALVTLLILGLAVWTALGRKARLDDEAITRRSRAHGNLVENALPFLVMMVLLDLQHAASVGLHLCGMLFLAVRLTHAWGLSQSLGASRPRLIGIVGTWAVLAGMAGWLLVQAIPRG